MLTMEHILRRAYPVLPVLVIDDVERAVSLAQALCAGGINVIEVTLRTPQALEALKVIRQEVPDLIVGAGTVIHTEQFAQVMDAGAQFAVSPGFTERLALDRTRNRTAVFACSDDALRGVVSFGAWIPLLEIVPCQWWRECAHAQ